MGTRDVQTLGGWAGIVGPVLFTAAFIVQELFRRDEYSPIAESVSALEAGPNGWVQQANFVVLGLLTIVFAIGLHRGLRRSRAGWIGPALLGLSGVGNILAAVFPLREDAAGLTYDPGGHAVAGILFFLTSALALIALSSRLHLDERWRSLAVYTAVAGFLALAGFVVMGVFVVPADAPLDDWVGLGQRILVLAVLFPCRVTLAIRLLQVARSKR
ncbi:DUF998 domain-containing protein [Aeromicrobium sp.]|uniref:DUF998 domain-containing protein n=1 Tax=Aeromicrobium sp. TaxID=1871063 RepID=UPI003D6AED77